jgi:hypothetical protein
MARGEVAKGEKGEGSGRRAIGEGGRRAKREGHPEPRESGAGQVR